MGDVKLIKMTSLEETNSKSEFKQSKNISCVMKDKKGPHR